MKPFFSNDQIKKLLLNLEKTSEVAKELITKDLLQVHDVYINDSNHNQTKFIFYPTKSSFFCNLIDKNYFGIKIDYLSWIEGRCERLNGNGQVSSKDNKALMISCGVNGNCKTLIIY